MTLPLSADPQLFASVFITCSFRELLKARNRGFRTDERITVITHGDDLPRSSSGLWASELSPHPLRIGEARSDQSKDDEGGVVINSDHKIGGEPYCIQEPELPGAAELFKQGYVQVLQLDVPGAADGGIRGNWPFGDGLFNLFGRPPFEQDFQWFFQG
jgi:hypothetical protein